ncbi:MAG: hypothetical protein H7196_00620 [candidate division SR1 bacterium]|nr:hypothetical protein [candidate division SR1 bacterium]
MNIHKIAKKQYNIQKSALKTTPKQKNIGRLIKNAYIDRKKKINKDNIIYYFVGFTLLIIFILYITPIIYQNLTKKRSEVFKIEYSQASRKDNLKIDASKIGNVIEDNGQKSIIENKEVKVGSANELLQIFQQSLNNKTFDNFKSYLERDAKLFVWKPSKTNGCCIVENSTNDYMIGFLKVISLDNPSWNFDQNQADIKGVQDIEGRFKDNYIGINNKDAMIGIKISSSNKISEINITISIKEVYNSTIDYNASGFQKVYLTEEQLKQISQK